MPTEISDREDSGEPIWCKLLVSAYLATVLLAPLLWKLAGWPDDLFTFPYAVGWAGALGACVQMAYGVMRHTEDWNGAYALWYFIGPLIGLATGIITYAVLMAGLNTFGGAPHGTVWAYIVAAFITGANYRQFNLLIQKAGNALLGTPGDPPGKHV